MPLKAAIAEDRTLSLVRVAIMLFTGMLAMITFVRSFIANRKSKRKLIYAKKAVLIGIITPNVTSNQANEYLEELAFLAKTAGAKPIKNFTQRLLRPDNKTFIGKGKWKKFLLLLKKMP